jgi:hypothetical protein
LVVSPPCHRARSGRACPCAYTGHCAQRAISHRYHQSSIAETLKSSSNHRSMSGSTARPCPCAYAGLDRRARPEVLRTARTPPKQHRRDICAAAVIVALAAAGWPSASRRLFSPLLQRGAVKRLEKRR